MNRPNILLIMLDQMRWDAIAAHGNPLIRTPSMDQLVDEGVTFSRAYTESPVCVPARAIALTGKLPHRTGVVDNDQALPATASTFPRLLGDAGYVTAAIGKMHFSPVRTSHGIQRLWLSEEIPESVDEDDYLRDLHAAGYGHIEEPHGVRHEAYYLPQPSQLPEDLHTTAWTGRRTVELLKAHAAEHPRRPLFCWTSFIKPHPPFDPPSPWYRMYDPLEMPNPQRHPDERLLFHQRLQHRVKWTRPDAGLDLIRAIRAYYYASVSFVDAWVGQILTELRRNGMADDTLVVLTADHGEYLGDHWSFGKRGFHDAAARIPLILRWPARLAPRRSGALVGLADLAPTLLAAAGIDAATLDADGHELLALAAGRIESVREYLVGHMGSGDRGLYACLDQAHKYVYSAADDRELLFSYIEPGGDLRDVAGDVDRAPVVSRLRKRLLDRFSQDGYSTPIDEHGWRRFASPRVPGEPDDRSAAGRGRQYAIWPRAEDRWHASPLAEARVGELHPNRYGQPGV